MKIIMIGPVYPFKTGLSYYTGLMYRGLMKKHDVQLLSYTMQYPKLLFKKEQKDYEDDTVKIDDVTYMIHTANPFNWISSARYINRQKPDLVIFQWLHPYFTPCFWSLAKLIKHSKIMFICHNVFPHERFPLDTWLTKTALRQGDFFVTHSTMDAEDLKSVVKNPNYKVAVHPAYNFFKIKNMTKEQGREILNIKPDEKVLLFFGLVREYKGLKHLLKAMPQVKETFSDCRLLIAGDFGSSEDQYRALINENGIEDCVDVYGGHIPIPQVEKFFAACDLVVLPYESATQSGVIQVAYSFRKPVLVTNVGGLPDVVNDNQTGFIVEPFDSKALSDAIERYFKENKAEAFKEHIEEEAYRFSWDRMTETIESFMEEKQ